MNQIMLHKRVRPQALTQRTLLFLLKARRSTNDSDPLPTKAFSASNPNRTGGCDKFGVKALAFPDFDVDPRLTMLICAALCQQRSMRALTPHVQATVEVDHVNRSIRSQ
jgi:hypothetical protein